MIDLPLPEFSARLRLCIKREGQFNDPELLAMEICAFAEKNVRAALRQQYAATHVSPERLLQAFDEIDANRRKEELDVMRSRGEI